MRIASPGSGRQVRRGQRHACLIEEFVTGRRSTPAAKRTASGSCGLTARELELMAEGRTNRQIARERFISPDTVSELCRTTGAPVVRDAREATGIASSADPEFDGSPTVRTTRMTVRGPSPRSCVPGGTLKWHHK